MTKAERKREKGQTYKVRRMTEIGSQSWGVYAHADTPDFTLIEGGFFDKSAAQSAADNLNRRINSLRSYWWPRAARTMGVNS